MKPIVGRIINDRDNDVANKSPTNDDHKSSSDHLGEYFTSLKFSMYIHKLSLKEIGLKENNNKIFYATGM